MSSKYCRCHFNQVREETLYTLTSSTVDCDDAIHDHSRSIATSLLAVVVVVVVAGWQIKQEEESLFYDLGDYEVINQHDDHGVIIIILLVVAVRLIIIYHRPLVVNPRSGTAGRLYEKREFFAREPHHEVSRQPKSRRICANGARLHIPLVRTTVLRSIALQGTFRHLLRMRIDVWCSVERYSRRACCDGGRLVG